MAWITKQSATMRPSGERDGGAGAAGGAPYLTGEMHRRIKDEIIPRYETRLACLLPALHLVQHEYGWIPGAAMKEIADALGVRPAEVLDTASFYEEYWLKPKGKHLVSVCRSIACECLGQREVTEALKAKLGVDVGETTDDDRFTLIELECLGACGGAPAILIDETLHEHVSPQAVGKLIEGVKDGPGGHGGHGGH